MSYLTDMLDRRTSGQQMQPLQPSGTPQVTVPDNAATQLPNMRIPQAQTKLQTLQPSGVPQVDVPANAVTKMKQEVAKSLETNFTKPKTI